MRGTRVSYANLGPTKVPTESPQRRRRRTTSGTPKGPKLGAAILALTADASVTSSGDGRPVIEMACGVTVYPAREDGDRWRAVWYENGQRRQCESLSEHALAVKLEKVTQRLVADAPNIVGQQVRTPAPGPGILTGRERLGHPERYQSHVLHVERDGSLSLVGLVWRPGQATTIHDHVAWGAFAVLAGWEYEEAFTLSPDKTALVPMVTRRNGPGDVSAFAPPGDIHRITNAGDQVVIQLHVYGTDVAMLGTSVRRVYELPVLSPRQ
jgi:3-mercaptopropionate dioxygenase